MKTLYILLLTLVSHLALAQNDFITRWNLATAGSGGTQLTFGVETSGTVGYTWQEVSPGTASGSGTFTGSTATITSLPSAAVIDLSISPTNFNRFIVNDGTDKNRLTDVRQWGTTAWTSMERTFFGCSNLQISATDVPDLGAVTSMKHMFFRCSVLNGPANIGTWNTTNVTDMSYVFGDDAAFNQNIGTWNTANVTTMAGMFSGASAFNQPIGTWDTGNVTNMGYLLFGAYTFNQPIGTWDTGNVTSMECMFFYAYAFNQPIGSWNTSSVTTMLAMFANSYVFNQPIGNWNTANVTNMSLMFNAATSFNKSLGSWKLKASVDLTSMFNAFGMDCDHYSATLMGWSANPGTPSGLSLGASDRSYGTNAVAARNNLITTKGWTITGDAASGSDCSSALPVTLVSFSGKKTAENTNTLKWITADEKDFDRFEVQRSSDAKSFEKIGVVMGQMVKGETNMGEPVNGQTVNGGTPKNGALSTYTFTDLTPGVSNYYRLKMVDVDGSFEYSRIVSMDNSAEKAVVGSFYPNPSTGKVFVDVYAVESGSWTLTLTDAGGKVIGTEVHHLKLGMNKIDLNRLSPGMNLVRFEHGFFSQVRKLIAE